HDFKRMARDTVVFGECLRDFDRAERAHVAVKVSALRHAVDVRAEKNRLQIVVATRAAADEIAGSINRSIKLRGTHQTHHVLTSLSIGLAVSDATDSALRVLAKLSECGEMLVKARTIDMQL